MRIAITYKNGEIFQHFGRSEFFKLYDIQEGVLISSAIIPTNGQGHGALGSFLSLAKVDAVICGGIGEGARNILKNANIEVYPGVSGNADEALQAFLKGELVYQSDLECHHHDHEGHNCTEHDCGSHCH